MGACASGKTAAAASTGRSVKSAAERIAGLLKRIKEGRGKWQKQIYAVLCVLRQQGVGKGLGGRMGRAIVEGRSVTDKGFGEDRVMHTRLSEPIEWSGESRDQNGGVLHSSTLQWLPTPAHRVIG